MVNAATVTAAIISFISLALIAIALATNSWIRFDTSKEGTDDYNKFNELITNTQFHGLELQYSMVYFGLWVGCYHETFISDNEISCGFVSSRCNATICWTRNYQEKTCQEDPVQPLANRCTAFRTTRAFTILGTLFLVFGAALLLVATCMTSSRLVWSATIFNAIAFVFALLSFVVFYMGVFKANSLSTVTNMGWSFIMLIVAAPLAFFATVFSLLGAVSTPVKEYGYEESE